MNDPVSRAYQVEALPPSLVRFEGVLQCSDSRALALRTLVWAEHQGLIDPSLNEAPDVLVVVASVYARFCAPTSPSERGLDLTARFLLLFFFIDDAAAEGLKAFVSDESEWSLGPLTPSLRQWFAELTEFDTCPPALRESFTRAFHDYLRARRVEPRLTFTPMTLDEHWAIRRRTILMDPYIDEWMIAARIDVDQFRREEFAEAQRLGTDIVILANDLGSVDKDREGGDTPCDPNLVARYADVHALTPAEARERLISYHNDMVGRYRATLEAALEREPSAAARSYADLLTGVVDGNLACLWTLKFRYRDVEPILRQLEWVSPRYAGTIQRWAEGLTQSTQTPGR